MINYAYGKNVVLQLIKNKKPISQVLVTTTALDEKFKSNLTQSGVSYQIVDRKQLDKYTANQVHQGVVALIESYPTYQLSQVLNQQKLGLLVLLDGLSDPHNLGAILRTCDGVGADGVIIGKHRSVGLTPAVAKVSTGAIDTIKVVEVTNLVQTIKQLKEVGYWVVGCDMAGQDYYQPAYDTPICLVVGSEGDGISRLVKEHCDYLVRVPMVGVISSLNVSVATALVLYQIQHRRLAL